MIGSVRRAARAAAVVLATAGLAVGAVAGSAGATSQTAAARRIGGVLRTRNNVTAPSAANMTYHGGRVMANSERSYLIFWEPPFLQNGQPATVSADYNSVIQQYFSDVGGNGLYNNNTQYYEQKGSNQRFIQNRSRVAGVWVDSSAYPPSGCSDPETPGNCLSDQQIQDEVTKAIQTNGWRSGLNSMFFVMTANGEGSCFSGVCAFAYYCAYHGSFGNNTIYANMPYGATPISGYPDGVCTTLSQFPNDHDADIEISILSHEQMEAVTDPLLNAWYDSGGAEIGDKCAYNYGPITLDGGKANEGWNGHFYVVQQEWSNQQSGCVQSGP